MHGRVLVARVAGFVPANVKFVRIFFRMHPTGGKNKAKRRAAARQHAEVARRDAEAQHLQKQQQKQQLKAAAARREAEALQKQALQRQQRAGHGVVHTKAANGKDPHAELQAAIRKQAAARVAVARAQLEVQLVNEEQVILAQRMEKAREAQRRAYAGDE